MSNTENREAIRELFTSGYDSFDKYRKFYQDCYNRPTTLTDDDIIDMVADSEDADSPNGWAYEMFKREQSSKD